MLEDDYFANKRASLGMDRQDTLATAQKLLDALYPGLAHALSLNDGVLKITTPNASVASDLRLRQVELVRRFSHVDITRIQISIRG